MRKIILYSACSLDNFIARQDGSVDWLDDPKYFLEGEDYGYHKFYETIDTTLMGNTTYQEILGFDVPFPYPDKTNYVFSRFKEHRDTEHVKFISTGVVDFVKAIKASEGKDIWLVGGAQINGILLKEQLVDKIYLTIIPIALGKGIPLFAGLEHEFQFNTHSCKLYPNGYIKLILEPDYSNLC